MRGRQKISHRGRGTIARPGYVSVLCAISVGQITAPTAFAAERNDGAGEISDSALAITAQSTAAAPSNASPQSRRTSTLSLPLVVEDRRLADVPAELSSDDVVALSAIALADALGRLISDDAQSALRGLGDGLVTIDRIRALGIDIQLNLQTLALIGTLDVKVRGARVIGGELPPPYAGANVIEPSRFALGLTGGLLATNDLSSGRFRSVDLSLASFVNIGGERGLNVVGGGTFGLQGTGRTFQRDRVVAFIDRPDSALRFSAGDLTAPQTRLSGSVDLLGASFERSYSLLQPIRNVRPVGSRSFVLERRSTIEVYNNGALVQSFVAEPGPIDLRNIPTANFSNNISIVVQDSLGRREVSSFAIANDINLLRQGISEFQVTAGVLRNALSSTGLGYSSKPVASGIFTYGVSDRITLVGNATVSERLQVIGGAVNAALLRGVGLLELNASNGRGLGQGVAVGLSYRGDPLGLPQSRNANLNISVTWQSADYRTLNDFDLRNTLKIDAITDYRFNVSRRLSVGFGASYYKNYGGQRANWSMFAGAQRTIGRFIVSANGRYFSRADGKKDIGAFLSVTRVIGRSLTASANYDTSTNRSRVELRKSRSLDLPEVEFAVNGQFGPNERVFGGNLAYANSRFESEISVVNQNRGTSNFANSIGQLRLQSGIALVDGKVGIGRNTANGFVMVSRNARLDDARIEVREGVGGRLRGEANGVGPAVIPIDSPYRPVLLRVSGVDVPEGYDIGAGDYAVQPGARSGLHIKVGTDAFHSVIAVLTTREGQPISLQSGVARPANGGTPIPIFTNRSGRVVITNLTAGSYTIEMSGIDQRFDFAVPDTNEWLTNLGTVKMEEIP